MLSQPLAGVASESAFLSLSWVASHHALLQIDLPCEDLGRKKTSLRAGQHICNRPSLEDLRNS